MIARALLLVLVVAAVVLVSELIGPWVDEQYRQVQLEGQP